MFEMLKSFGEWLASTELSQTVRSVLTSSQLAAPGVQTLHILSIAVVIGSAGAICLKLLGASAHSLPALTRRFLPAIWCALVVMLLTGSVLIINRPRRYFDNWSFLTKVTLILIVVSLLVGLQAALRRNPQMWETASISSKTYGAVIMLLFVAIIFAGRWIAYI